MRTGEERARADAGQNSAGWGGLTCGLLRAKFRVEFKLEKNYHVFIARFYKFKFWSIFFFQLKKIFQVSSFAGWTAGCGLVRADEKGLRAAGSRLAGSGPARTHLYTRDVSGRGFVGLGPGRALYLGPGPGRA